VWVLAEELRGLARIHEGLAQGRAFNDLCRENRVWGEPRTSIVRRAAQRLDRRSIEAALSHAARIDRIGKGIGKGDAWDELLSLGTRFAAAP
jgi:DNA polymerase-3 subunit delta